MNKYYGKRVFEGIAIGKIIKYVNKTEVTNSISLGYDEELKRFNDARCKAVNYYTNLYENSMNKGSNEDLEILLSFKAILEDLDFEDNVVKYLKDNINCEQAVLKAINDLQTLLFSLDNEYIKERTKDIKEAGTKLISFLQSTNQNILIDDYCIVIADEMTASDLIEIDKKYLLGLVLENTSPNAHIAILARSLAIPTIASINQEIKYDDSNDAILDGKNGLLITNPSEKEIGKYQRLLNQKKQLIAELQSYRTKQVKTIDGKTLKIYSNITSSYEIESVLQCNADGIGLFRSEFIFLNSTTFPTEDEQFIHYKNVLVKMKDKPTIIRTMDIGADKQATYFNIPKEANPALGYRGVRMYKDFKEVLVTQLKALLRASVYGNLKIMIPMITNKEEVLFVLDTINEVKQTLKTNNIKFNNDLEIGIMIETPAAALICDELAPLVNFFSIGTNDLSQYVLAVDRENTKVFDAYISTHKAILRLIYFVAKTAKKYNLEVGICGELAREKELLGFFINCGVDEISVSSSYVLECKKNLTEINTKNEMVKKYIGESYEVKNDFI